MLNLDWRVLTVGGGSGRVVGWKPHILFRKRRQPRSRPFLSSPQQSESSSILLQERWAVSALAASLKPDFDPLTAKPFLITINRLLFCSLDFLGARTEEIFRTRIFILPTRHRKAIVRIAATPDALLMYAARSLRLYNHLYATSKHLNRLERKKIKTSDWAKFTGPRAGAELYTAASLHIYAANPSRWQLLLPITKRAVATVSVQANGRARSEEASVATLQGTSIFDQFLDIAHGQSAVQFRSQNDRATLVIALACART